MPVSMHEPIAFPDLESYADGRDIHLERRFNCLLVVVALDFLGQIDEIAVIEELKTV
jgi:hypothetical protein